MLKICYRYEKVKDEDKKSLVGIDCYECENGKCIKYGYFYGIELTCEDAIKNQNMLGITNIEDFIRDYKNYNAIGVIYFPQCESFGFLEENDIVLSSFEELSIVINDIQNGNIKEKLNIDLYDMEDSFLELCDFSNVLERVSNR